MIALSDAELDDLIATWASQREIIESTDRLEPENITAALQCLEDTRVGQLVGLLNDAQRELLFAELDRCERALRGKAVTP